MSLLSFGAVVVDLYSEVGALRIANASLQVEVAALHEELGHAASRSEVEALAADLVLLREAYMQAAQETAAAEHAGAARNSEAGEFALAHAGRSGGPAGGAERPAPWYATLKDRAALYGSQLLKALAEALGPRPVFH